MSERVRDTGEVSFPAPHAAGREGGGMVLPRGLLMSFYIPFILHERSSPFPPRTPGRSAVPVSYIPLLPSRYPSSITGLKGSLL